MSDVRTERKGAITKFLCFTKEKTTRVGGGRSVAFIELMLSVHCVELHYEETAEGEKERRAVTGPKSN